MHQESSCPWLFCLKYAWGLRRCCLTWGICSMLVIVITAKPPAEGGALSLPLAVAEFCRYVTDVHTYVCVYACVHICAYICMHMYACMHGCAENCMAWSEHVGIPHSFSTLNPWSMHFHWSIREQYTGKNTNNERQPFYYILWSSYYALFSPCKPFSTS